MQQISISNEITLLPWSLNYFNAWREDFCANLRSKRVNHIYRASKKFRCFNAENMNLDEKDQINICKEFLYFCSEGNRSSISDRSILQDYTIQKKSDEIFNERHRIGTIGALIAEYATQHAEKELMKLGLQKSPHDIQEAARGDTYLLQLDELIKICTEVEDSLREWK